MWLDEVNQNEKKYWDENYDYKEYSILTTK